MARRRSGFQKKIDTVHWTYGSFVSVGLAAGVAAVQAFPAALLRTRGEWVGLLDGAQAPGKLVSVGIGMIQVPEGTGTTVLWSPISDGDAPWIWVDYAMLGYEEMVNDVIDVPMLTGVRRIIDSKGMRKLRNTELQVVFENATVQTAATVNISGQVRVLAGS